MFKHSEDIADYVLNQMSDEQKEAFEQRMAGDRELAAEVERHKQVFDFLSRILPD